MIFFLLFWHFEGCVFFLQTFAFIHLFVSAGSSWAKSMRNFVSCCFFLEEESTTHEGCTCSPCWFLHVGSSCSLSHLNVRVQEWGGGGPSGCAFGFALSAACFAARLGKHNLRKKYFVLKSLSRKLNQICECWVLKYCLDAWEKTVVWVFVLFLPILKWNKFGQHWPSFRLLMKSSNIIWYLIMSRRC